MLGDLMAPVRRLCPDFWVLLWPDQSERGSARMKYRDGRTEPAAQQGLPDYVCAVWLIGRQPILDRDEHITGLRPRESNVPSQAVHATAGMS